MMLHIITVWHDRHEYCRNGGYYAHCRWNGSCLDILCVQKVRYLDRASLRLSTIRILFKRNSDFPYPIYRSDLDIFHAPIISLYVLQKSYNYFWLEGTRSFIYFYFSNYWALYFQSCWLRVKLINFSFAQGSHTHNRLEYMASLIFTIPLPILLSILS